MLQQACLAAGQINARPDARSGRVGRRCPGLADRRLIQHTRRMALMMDDTGARIARWIRIERDARGWALAELAERSGVSKATISKIEREETSPTAVILVRLAGAFDLTLAGCRAPPSSRYGATLTRGMCAARCSAGPIIRWRWSKSSCRRVAGWRSPRPPMRASARRSGFRRVSWSSSRGAPGKCWVSATAWDLVRPPR
jgi:transcriptional regulator with XRE-family HTH domain